jgi:hypothetical protein
MEIEKLIKCCEEQRHYCCITGDRTSIIGDSRKIEEKRQ